MPIGIMHIGQHPCSCSPRAENPMISSDTMVSATALPASTSTSGIDTGLASSPTHSFAFLNDKPLSPASVPKSGMSVAPGITGITRAALNVVFTLDVLPVPLASTNNAEATDQSHALVKHVKGLAIVGSGVTEKYVS